MTVHGPDDTQITVLTFKDGLLSRVAHDLQIRATAFEIDIDPATGRVTARVESSSLRVDHAMKNGMPAPSALSRDDRTNIEKNLREDVLHCARFREIRFAGTWNDDARARGILPGTLTLHGTTRPVTLRLRQTASSLVAEGRLDQRAWGIEPYRAMMGTLRVQPIVTIRITSTWLAT